MITQEDMEAATKEADDAILVLVQAHPDLNLSDKWRFTIHNLVRNCFIMGVGRGLANQIEANNQGKE